MFVIILLTAAFICFVLAALVPSPPLPARPVLTATGLACWVLAALLEAAHVIGTR